MISIFSYFKKRASRFFFPIRDSIDTRVALEFKKYIQEKKVKEDAVLYSLYHYYGLHFLNVGDLDNAIFFFERISPEWNDLDPLFKQLRKKAAFELAHIYLFKQSKLDIELGKKYLEESKLLGSQQATDLLEILKLNPNADVSIETAKKTRQPPNSSSARSRERKIMLHPIADFIAKLLQSEPETLFNKNLRRKLASALDRYNRLDEDNKTVFEFTELFAVCDEVAKGWFPSKIREECKEFINGFLTGTQSFGTPERISNLKQFIQTVETETHTLQQELKRKKLTYSSHQQKEAILQQALDQHVATKHKIEQETEKAQQELEALKKQNQLLEKKSEKLEQQLELSNQQQKQLDKDLQQMQKQLKLFSENPFTYLSMLPPQKQNQELAQIVDGQLIVNFEQLGQYLKCPISHEEPFEQPCLTPDGHTFSRTQILQWAQKSNMSPVTNQPMNNDFRPNGIAQQLGKFYQANKPKDPPTLNTTPTVLKN